MTVWSLAKLRLSPGRRWMGAALARATASLRAMPTEVRLSKVRENCHNAMMPSGVCCAVCATCLLQGVSALLHAVTWLGAEGPEALLLDPQVCVCHARVACVCVYASVRRGGTPACPSPWFNPLPQ
jgi:hypothetical protein